MILVDREDFEGLGFQDSLFLRRWVPGEPEAIACDYADVPAPGPFLIKAHDDAVWMSHDGEDWMKIASNPRYQGPEQKRWSHLTTIYAEHAGMSLNSLVQRLKSVRHRLMNSPNRWTRWIVVYPWDEGSDLVWQGIIHHPKLETREYLGEKEVRYVV